MDKLLYNLKEVMALTGLGKTTLYRHIKEGNLKPRKIGGRTLFSLDDVKEFLGQDRPVTAY